MKRPSLPRRLAALLGIGGAVLLRSVAAAQPTTGFAIVGHIERLELANPADPVGGATMTVRGVPIVLPRNLLVTMPGGYLTPQDLFRFPQGIEAASGLALADAKPPPVPVEAEVLGNLTGGRYVAGVVRISQGALHVGAGYIQSIDPAKGELVIATTGGAHPARVRLNDPKGIYGMPNDARPDIPMDARFALDPDNVPVHARTGFPVCIPRTVDPAKCPAANRPSAAARRFTCAVDTQQASAAPDIPIVKCDPTRPVPLMVGDFVTFAGMLVPVSPDKPADGYVVAAHELDAELGIYTAKGVDPAYLFVEDSRQGTVGEQFGAIPQEETARFRIVGFTTDPSRNVEVLLFDSDRTTVEPDPVLGPDKRAKGTVTGQAGLTPSNGPQLGRFRGDWPSIGRQRAVRRDVLVQIVGAPHPRMPTGLLSGTYNAPITEYIFPEATSFGVTSGPLPVPFENFCFLALGGGKWKTLGNADVTLGPLDPFPQSGHPLSQQIGAGSQRVCDGG